MDEALALVDMTGARVNEAELYRLRGELKFARSSIQSLKSGVQENQKEKTCLELSHKKQNSENADLRPLTSDPQGEAEACFLKAIDIARQQQAKLFELRAVMSLVRLQQQQALAQGAQSREQRARSKKVGVRNKELEAHTRLDEAYQMLSDIYQWFAEGFDTKDLQEARTLLEELSDSISK